MKAVDVEFVRLSDVSLEDLLGATGVYAVWSGKARVRPTYIGEGVILERVAAHVKEFAWPLRGVLAIPQAKTWREQKEKSEIAEALLLAVAKEVDLFPTRNKRYGNEKKVKKALRKHNVLRLNVKGYDPLLGAGSRRLRRRKSIAAKLDNGDDFLLKYDWNTRSTSR